ncbi:MAG: MotA/TolQ/ExbB proton channel family protein [bacterium]
MEGKQCPKCGDQNFETADFCKKCGSSLRSKDSTKEDKTGVVRADSQTISGQEVKQAEIVGEIDEEQTIGEEISSKFDEQFDNSHRGKTLAFLRIIPPISGLLITIIFQKFIITTFSYGSFIYRLFLPPGGFFQKIVPSIILFLFSWSLVDLLITIIRVLREKRHLKNGNLSGIPHSLFDEDSDSVMNQLHGLERKIKKGRIYRRIYSLLEHLYSSDDLQRSHEFFRHQSDIASDNASSGYSTVRTFIWAMPILGFIGTVIGIGLAVGNFSGFLTGDIDNIELVKHELSKVATGLSYAFDTTLLGLVASLIAMLITSFVQKNEEGLLTDLEELGLEIIANFKIQPSYVSYEKSNDSFVDSMENFTTVMNSHTKSLSKSIENFTGDFKETSTKLSDRFSDLPVKIDEDRDNFKREMETVLQTMLAGLAKLTSSFQETAQNLNNEFSAVAVKTQANQETLKTALTRLSDLNMELGKTFIDGTSRFTSSSELLAEKVESVISTQSTTIKALDSINAFSQLLREMQETQAKILPLLGTLSGPLEFKLVPSQTNDDSRHPK